MFGFLGENTIWILSWFMELTKSHWKSFRENSNKSHKMAKYLHYFDKKKQFFKKKCTQSKIYKWHIGKQFSDSFSYRVKWIILFSFHKQRSAYSDTCNGFSSTQLQVRTLLRRRDWLPRFFITVILQWVWWNSNCTHRHFLQLARVDGPSTTAVATNTYRTNWTGKMRPQTVKDWTHILS